MANDPTAGAPYLDEGQDGAEPTVNDAIDALALCGYLVVEAKQNSPPGSPTNGKAYLVGASPTGAWGGQPANMIAYYNNGWQFPRALRIGEAFTNLADKKIYILGTGGATDLETVYTYT